ncbi:MAG: hypothetical protein M1820_000574 [Bogoriella megaspora]|nr:MAG: hypothetical protein M1820_000574 [Bogoriella megaspora]
MSLLKGIQSAIFYYLSCAPCTEAAHKKRRRKQAAADRAERLALEMEQPGLYRHPSPFATNPYWGEEITLGPGPPPRRTRKKTKDSVPRGITTAGTQSTNGSISTGEGGLSALIKSPLGDRRHSLNLKNWNIRRYQREDEALWGQNFENDSFGHSTMVGGSSIGLSGASRTETAYSRNESMYIARNPPVNDLHPPVVSTPSSNLHETRWMLQPPPTAKIMAGKERATGSGSRSRSNTANRSLSQQRIPVLAQLKVFDPDIPDVPIIPDVTPKDRSLSSPEFPQLGILTPTRSISSGGRKRRRPDPLTIHNGSALSSTAAAQTVIKDRNTNQAIDVADFANATGPLKPERSHNRLSTILSENTNSSHNEKEKENSPNPSNNNISSSSETVGSTSSSTTKTSQSLHPHHQQQRPPLIVSDSSLQILEELVSPSALLDSRFVKAPAVEARISLPPTTSVEDLQLRQLERVDWMKFPWEERKENEDEERKDSGMASGGMERISARWSMDI